MMRTLVLALLLVALPFVVFGETLEAAVAEWARQPRSPLATAAAVVAALALDIALPVPSSGVVSFAAGPLGWLGATLAGTLGLTISCELGYRGAAALTAAPAASSNHSDKSPSLSRVLLGLAATRAIPLVAEAAVLVAGRARVPHSPFLVTVAAANALVCGLFAGLGRWGVATGEEAVAIGVSLAVPVLIAIGVELARRGRAVSHDRGTSGERGSCDQCVELAEADSPPPAARS